MTPFGGVRTLLLLSLLWFVACGTNNATLDSGAGTPDMGADAGTDLGRDAGDVVLGPDGAVGLCCPVSLSCDCSYKGGWAPSLETCGQTCDQGPGEGTQTDEYGCEYVYGSYPCLVLPDMGLLDLGINDAATDATTEDMSESDGSTGSTPEERCVETGGTVTSGLCCAATDDFPSSCSIGACGCAPDSSHEIQKCECPGAMCFDPTVGCVTT